MDDLDKNKIYALFEKSKHIPFKDKARHLSKEFYKHSKKWILISLLVVFIGLILVSVGTYAYFAQDIYSKDKLMNRNDSGLILLDRNNKPFFTFYQPKLKTAVSLSQIPKTTQQAVIAIEDKDFYKHPGFSITAIIRALFMDVKNEGFSYGASTITQQLVKNVLLTSKKNILRKYQEIVLAAEIDRVYSKEEILEMYLNSVYFGEGAFGIESAAHTYFNKSAKDLTLAESAELAAILNSPSALSPISNDPTYAKDRQKVVLQKMYEQKYIDKNQEDQAVNQKLTFNPQKEDINTVAPHFALMVRDELISKYGEENVARSGMKVKTTLDLDWQKIAEKAVSDQINRLSADHVSNGAAVAIDPKTGEVRVLVGSKNWYDEKVGKINMATTPRQPGSSFKPIVYSAALEKRLITPATILQDEPRTFGTDYRPHNFDGKFRGPISVRKALSNSLNIPAIEVLEKLGINEAVDKAKLYGITTLKDPSQYGLSLVLGAAEVPLVELTNAYSSFATYGTRSDITLINSITDKNGQEIYHAKTTTHQVLSPEAGFLISSILSDNNARADVFGTSLNLSRPAAVKTGTTDDNKDALTVGFTPSLVVGVWVGNNDNTPMDRIGGSVGAGPIWKTLMEQFLKGTPVEQFNAVGNITDEFVCKEKGLKVLEASSSAYKEYFISGTEPQDLCYPPTPTPEPVASESPEPSVSPTEMPTLPPLQVATPTPTPTPTPTSTPFLQPVVPIH